MSRKRERNRERERERERERRRKRKRANDKFDLEQIKPIFTKTFSSFATRVNLKITGDTIAIKCVRDQLRPERGISIHYSAKVQFASL